tara:strand:- start:379 stop:612 length:234 start_codon:yes stop_codon:yes gene_type:complete
LDTGLENIETMSKISIKNTLKKLHKFKFLIDLNFIKINNNKSSTISKIKNSKYNSYIIHNNCGTPDCCGQCETAIKN